MPYSGSSPRTRGTRRSAPGVVTRGRFIPAYTGNSSATAGTTIMLPVHPRVHGELRTQALGGAPVDGSSPRTRGTRCAGIQRLEVDRFIPAYTGNSRPRPGGPGPVSVHPRVHGELSCAYHLPVEHQFRPAGDALRSSGPPWTVPAGSTPSTRLFIETPSIISTRRCLSPSRHHPAGPARGTKRAWPRRNRRGSAGSARWL